MRPKIDPTQFDDVDQKFGWQLKKLRRKLHFTLFDVSEMTGIEIRRLKDIESGGGHYSAMREEVEALAKVLHVPYDSMACLASTGVVDDQIRSLM